jgi:hypothetical protein
MLSSLSRKRGILQPCGRRADSRPKVQSLQGSEWGELDPWSSPRVELESKISTWHWQKQKYVL